MSFLDSIFGGSSSKSSSQSQSQSGNTAYPWAQSTFGSGAGGAYNSGVSGLEGLLGLSGGDPGALQKFWSGTGGDFLLNQGTNAVNSNMYARGLGKSGADMKGLEDYRSGLASTKLNDLMQNYMGLAKLGLGGGSLVTDAGQYSNSTSSSSSKGHESTGNLGKALGGLLAFI